MAISYSGDSWMNRALGSARYPDPFRDDDMFNLEGLVRAYVRNDLGMSRKDVNRIVNAALLEEMTDLTVARHEMHELANYWEAEADRPGAPRLAKQQAKTSRASVKNAWDEGRIALAETVRVIREEGLVPLDPTTCQTLVNMDQEDGLMGEVMGRPLAELFADNPAYRGPVEAPDDAPPMVRNQPPKRADFSKEVDEKRYGGLPRDEDAPFGRAEPGRHRVPRGPGPEPISTDPVPTRQKARPTRGLKPISEAIKEAMEQIRAEDAAAKAKQDRGPSL